MEAIMNAFQGKKFAKDEPVFLVNGNLDYLYFLLIGKATLTCHASASDPNPSPVVMSFGLITGMFGHIESI